MRKSASDGIFLMLTSSSSVYPIASATFRSAPSSNFCPLHACQVLSDNYQYVLPVVNIHLSFGLVLLWLNVKSSAH